MPMVDMHAHFMTDAYRAALDQHGQSGLDGFPLPAWSAADHYSLMDELSIDKCLLSISSPHPWFGDAEEAADLARSLNNEAAAICAHSAGRMLFAASLPVPDVDASVAEVERALGRLDAAAVKLPTNAGGVYLGDPRLEPLMDALDARGAIVVLHPCAAPGTAPDCLSGRLKPLMEFPADTTRAVIELICSGTVERHPHVRFVVPHCGSFVPRTLPRLLGMSRVLGMDVSKDSLASFWWDLAGDVTPETLAELLTITDRSHLLYGSDYPFTPSFAVAEKTAGLKALLGNDWQAVTCDNPAALLGI